jgi:hypothetical protein
MRSGPVTKRTRYFDGQLLAASDLAQDQLYFREKARRHNRMLHGWGVVCGLDVGGRPGTSDVVVAPGYAIDATGEEILIEREVTFDLCKEDRDGNAVSPCSDAADDPSRGAVQVDRTPDQPLYVAVGYAECYESPVPLAAGGSEGTTELSRVRESYAVKVLTELPATYSLPTASVRARRLGRAKPERQMSRACPEPPSEPWVIIADVVLGSNLEVVKVDCVTHRRYAASAVGR